jgi:hypothetical protein
MIINSDNPNKHHYQVVRESDGKVLTNCVSFDSETGEAELPVLLKFSGFLDADYLKKEDGTPDYVKVKLKGFVLIDKRTGLCQ